MLLLQLPPSFHLNAGEYRSGGSAKSQLISSPSLHGGDGSPFSDSVTPNYTTDSKCVVGVKPGGSGVVMEYQVDEFTCTWLAECLLHNHTFTFISQTRCQH